ncbi:hypothetical protein Cni_G22172 [Canna indica]|uniref:Uncharacterized protein n=1 Tax=Canna indica TaxID=4628 RepID=A0AAQ3KTU0_9LILI|nr:hypothetical protein Cni_G22172 [Canna indica]
MLLLLSAFSLMLLSPFVDGAGRLPTPLNDEVLGLIAFRSVLEDRRAPSRCGTRPAPLHANGPTSSATLPPLLGPQPQAFSGRLPDDLALLPFIRSLDLSFNSLAGPIPDTLFSSSAAGATCGSATWTISSLSQCSFLLQLNLSDNKLSCTPDFVNGIWPLSRLSARLVSQFFLQADPRRHRQSPQPQGSPAEPEPVLRCRPRRRVPPGLYPPTQLSHLPQHVEQPTLLPGSSLARKLDCRRTLGSVKQQVHRCPSSPILKRSEIVRLSTCCKHQCSQEPVAQQLEQVNFGRHGRAKKARNSQARVQQLELSGEIPQSLGYLDNLLIVHAASDGAVQDERVEAAGAQPGPIRSRQRQ